MSPNDIDANNPEIRNELDRILQQERREAPSARMVQPGAGNPPPSSGPESMTEPLKSRIKQLPLVGPALYWLVSLLRLGSMRQQFFRDQAQLREQQLLLQQQRQHLQLLEDYVRTEIGDKKLIRIHQNLYDQLRHLLEHSAGPLMWEQRLARLQERVNRLEPAPADGRAGESEKSGLEAKNSAGQMAWDNFYWDLEERFRGDESSIRERLEPYSTLISRIGSQQARPLRALDVGCGRGEWLAYLASQNWEVSGIDSSDRMVEACHARGLHALHMDILEGLSLQEDDSLCLISALHVVEHIPLETLFRFLDLAMKKLRPGGFLLLETPDPGNLRVGTNNFYIDPTHIRPIPSVFLQFVVEHRGFVRPEILPLHPYPTEHGSSQLDATALLLNHYLFGPQDYAIVACKP